VQGTIKHVILTFSVSLSGVPTTPGYRARAMEVFAIYPLKGHRCLLAVPRKDNGRQERTMSSMKRYATRPANARQRRRLPACERLARDRHQAQRAAEALHKVLEALGLPANLVAAIEGRLRSQQKLLSQTVGVMLPALCGCRTPAALCRVRGEDKHRPARLLRALPKHSWSKRLRRVGLEVLEPLWRHGPDQSPAPQSRWPGTWVWDAARMVSSCGQLARGGAASSRGYGRALMGFDGSWWWVMAAWACQSIVPCDGVCAGHVNTREGFGSLLRSGLCPPRGLSPEQRSRSLSVVDIVHHG